MEDDEGNIFKSLPMSDDMKEAFDQQRQQFLQEHGQEIGPDDLVFSDMPHPEHLEHQMVEAMKIAGIDPAIIYAVEQTGRIVSEENQHLLSDVELGQWNAAIEEYNGKHRVHEPLEFPIGTVALYGPDDQRTTKIVAGVILNENAEPILKRWIGTKVTEDPKIQNELKDFFDRHGVTSVAAADQNMGCPHEEGEDFPVGEDCPFCPYWKGRQGSNAPF